MRCRKTRFFLSAFCSDELNPRKAEEISAHLTECADCRKEEAVYRSMLDNSREIPKFKVSSDFNNKLMDRIAHERFAETRSKAYLPKNPPLLSWPKLVSAVATVCILFVATYLTVSNIDLDSNPTQLAAEHTHLDDSYLTAMPTNNPNYATRVANVDKNWSFNQQMAKNERMMRLSNTLTSSSTNDGFHRSSTHRHSSIEFQQIPLPYLKGYFKIRPIIKVYVSPKSLNNKEAPQGY